MAAMVHWTDTFDGVERAYQHGCAGKQQYPSFNAAVADLQRMIEENDSPDAKHLDIYQCRFGEHYHLGHDVKCP